RAGATLKLLDPAKGAPAPPPARTNQAMYGADDPLSLIPFADKVALCQRIDAVARARDPRVAQVSVTLAGSWSVIDIVRGDGVVGLFRPPRRAGSSAGRDRSRRRGYRPTPRLADHRRRRHADPPHLPDRGRDLERLSAGPPERPADGHGADRQRPARKLRSR